MKNKVAFISLGCAKNLYDSEMVLGLLNKMGYEVTPFQAKADLIIINTCGFIYPAKKESIDTICEIISNKKENQKIIVIGCLATRYKEALEKGFPEVNAIVSIKDYSELSNIITKVMNEKSNNYCLNEHNRLITTPSFTAYVRIGDGCDNNCAYCAIPLIRGGFKSRKIDDVVIEVNELVAKGYKEIVLIAQDTTRFGEENGERIEDLLLKLEKTSADSIRLLYLYPDEISDQLIDIISSSNKICHYFDIPIQHASDKILLKMNRRGDKKHIQGVIDKIRDKCHDAILRTTVMVGFPYETNSEYKELIQFIKYNKFDRLGCFKYSKEDDTTAYDMPQIKESIKERRYNKLLKIQAKIAKKLSSQKVGNIYSCYIEGYDSKLHLYKSRSYAFSGDDVDGYVYIKNAPSLNIGDKVNVRIVDYSTYDLIGEIIK